MLRKSPCMVVTPKESITAPLTALMACGVSMRFVSRCVAVTMTSSMFSVSCAEVASAASPKAATVKRLSKVLLPEVESRRGP